MASPESLRGISESLLWCHFSLLQPALRCARETQHLFLLGLRRWSRTANRAKASKRPKSAEISNFASSNVAASDRKLTF